MERRFGGGARIGRVEVDDQDVGARKCALVGTERVIAMVFSSMRAEKLPEVAGTHALAAALRPASITADTALCRRLPSSS